MKSYLGCEVEGRFSRCEDPDGWCKLEYGSAQCNFIVSDRFTKLGFEIVG